MSIQQVAVTAEGPVAGSAAPAFHLGHRPALDGVRGVAILLVMGVHSLATPSLGAQPAAGLTDRRFCSRVADVRLPAARDSMTRALGTADSALAAFFRGCLAMTDGNADEAVAQFERAVRQREQEPVFHFWLGRAYADQSEAATLFARAQLASRSRAAIERAVALAPDYLDARDLLVQFFLRAPAMLGGGTDRARAEAEEIARRNAYRGGLARAAVARRTGDHAAAEQIYRDLIAQHPDSAMPRLELISALSSQRRWRDAWAVADEFERAQPSAMAARYAVGRVAAESGEQLARGERALREYLAHEPRDGAPPMSRAHLRLGALLERSGQVDAARREYRAALALEPKLRAAREALERLR